ncbi:exopolysaccharide biosynthesis polyprenyl glycosylphosphotransferase [Nocardioides pantholopis]|uniref:exopolysaccharide biosynthesis polyprenyl glycosylphosphotransferase n=1 Tax=Nocardioides pantholopis TaxID=2483798 RepID=UPI000F085830|nr:exopolysaccharide biosynthesis polyprenyl glycosylphosphotransferase [Nocardioides pantholopis]
MSSVPVPTSGSTVVADTASVLDVAPRLLRPGLQLATAVAADLAVAVGALGLATLAGGPMAPGLVLCVPLVWLLLLAVAGDHTARRRRLMPALGDAVRPVLRAGAVAGLAGWVVSVRAPDAAGSEQLMLLAALLVGGTLLLRTAPVLPVPGPVTALGRRLGAVGTPATPVVVLGHAGDVAPVLDELRRPGRPLTPVGVCLVEPAAHTAGVVTMIGCERTAELVDRTGAQAVVVVPGPGLDPSVVRRLGWELEARRVEMLMGTGLVDVSSARTSVAYAGALRLLRVRDAGRHGARWAVKVAWERLAAAAALILLAPLLLAVTLAVRTTSPGPALFRQTRVGRDGRPFTMLKFRTMRQGTETVDQTLAARNEVAGGVLFKLRQDPRITPVGRVLRRYSLDELPQLLNVVRGEMSLIGPRPALPQEVARYDADPRRRLAVRPGLTGLWQVSGRSDLSWEETVRLDLSYVDNWSLGLDLAIVARTVGAVLGHRGAY